MNGPYLAILHTGSFEFMACGRDAEQALEVLRRGWREHARRTGARWQWSELADSVDVVEVPPGTVLRDRSTPLIGARTAFTDRDEGGSRATG
ncbi:hypothetical protein LZ318_30770 [Saccharopolyspora indica]|uniref:hypothetical protein n=1 Tax=Saccharopolyspora indica TaxID=1229659 RepID=UPI0022EA3E9C|nr:hypothetical protein [Saccharopolyspora indica]MDA3644384.1 hypothetical protein [Saccharopolyspora indica]